MSTNSSILEQDPHTRSLLNDLFACEDLLQAAKRRHQALLKKRAWSDEECAYLDELLAYIAEQEEEIKALQAAVAAAGSAASNQ